MLKELIKLANELDKRGLRKEADALDSAIRTYANAGLLAILTGPIFLVGAVKIWDDLTMNDEEKSLLNEVVKRSFINSANRRKASGELDTPGAKKELDMAFGRSSIQRELLDQMIKDLTNGDIDNAISSLTNSETKENIQDNPTVQTAISRLRNKAQPFG